MSQHLISQFINRTYVFKPFNDAKLVNQKLKKHQASNRENNSSPEDVAESTHILQKIKTVQKKEEPKEAQSSIDIII